VKKIHKRLTYANVMSSIAVFLVLGGATALAAGLAKNSVGSKQLKKNAVTAAKIKKNAVTGAKIAGSAVDGSKVKDGSLTGADINLGSLGTVPSADKAKTADSAGSANTANTANSAKTADTASKTNQIAHIFYTAPEGSGTHTILSDYNGLTIKAKCPTGEDIELEAETSVNHALIDVVTAQDNDYEYDEDFETGEAFDLDEGHSEGFTEMYTAQYTNPNGQDVALIIHDVDAGDGPAFPGTPQESDCLVSGFAFGS